MPTRRAFGVWALAMPLALAGCGWEPLYADRATVPADAELRAVSVPPIAERIGQKLEIALRDSLNPTGIPTRQKYVFHVTLQVVRADLGVLTQGLGTRGRVDVYARYLLNESKTGAVLLSGTSHVAQSFDILANEYSNIVGEDDARNRAVEELRRDLLDRLTVFMQRRIAATKP